MLNQALFLLRRVRKDNIMAEFDPIANIKRFSPTAHLQKREADTGSALQRLMSGRLIQSDRDVAAGQRQKASDLSRLTGTLAPHGLSPGGLSPEVLGRIRGQIGAKQGADTIAGLVKGGWRYGKETGPTRPGDIYQKEATPGHMLPGEAQSARLPRLTSEQDRKKTLKRWVKIPDGKGGFSFAEETTVEGSKQSGQSKGGTEATARVNQLHKIVSEMLKARGRPFKTLEILGETATHIKAKIDGVETPVRIDK